LCVLDKKHPPVENNESEASKTGFNGTSEPRRFSIHAILAEDDRNVATGFWVGVGGLGAYTPVSGVDLSIRSRMADSLDL